MQIKKGTVLPNGATVIQKKGDIVLARFKGEFVTWAVDNYGNCSSGRYYLKESEAKKSFERRSKNHLKEDQKTNWGTIKCQ